MAKVKRTVTGDLGAATLKDGEYLEYLLSPSGGEAIWAYACEDHALESSHLLWYLSAIPISTLNPLYLLDRKVDVPDIYTVRLSFAQTSGYRLLVRKQPSNTTIQDINYLSQDPASSFPEPLDVTRVTG
jgi:hypothetical protein